MTPQRTRLIDPALFLLFSLVAGCDHGTTISTTVTCSACTVTPPEKATLIVTSPAGTLTAGQPGVIRGTVTPSSATGTIALTDVTYVYVSNPSPFATAALQQATVDIPVTPPNAGTRTYTATYSGDANFSGASAALSIIVTAPASASSCGLGTAAYVLSSGSASPTQSSFAATLPDQSAVCAQNFGTTLTLASPVISKSGSGNYQYGDSTGVNAAVLAFADSTAASGPTINLAGSPAVTSYGATYALFASGPSSTINLTNASVTSTSTTAALGVGNNGALNVSNSTITSDSNPLFVSGGGAVSLQNTSLASTAEAGALRFFNKATATATATFRMIGGSISSAAPVTTSAGPNILVSDNQTIDMLFSNVDFSSLNTTGPRSFVEVQGSPVLTLTFDREQLVSPITATSLTLQNGSSVDGIIFVSNLTLDASSSLTIHSTIALQTFNDPGGISGTQVLNVTGNGQTLTYSKTLNPQLGGLTYTLKGSGSLIPY